jgi:hypothetical protein
MTTTPPPFSPFVYARAIRASDLPPIARHVALTLTSYANRNGDAWPSQETLQRGTGWARRTVNNALNDLEASGWLARVVRGHQGRATVYRLQVPGDSGGLHDPTPPSPKPLSAATLVQAEAENGAVADHEEHGQGDGGEQCTSGPETEQLTTTTTDVTCTPTPSGERSDRTPSGSALAAPQGIPDDLWAAATPLLGMLLTQLPPHHADRLVERWPLLTKARDFCWQLTALAGTNPRTRTTDARWTPEGLVEALTAVTLDDVEQPERALYRRLMNVVVGRDAVPPSEDPRRRMREVWTPPAGQVGDAITALAQRLAMPPVSRSA